MKSQYQQGNSKYSNCVIYFVLWLIIFVDINLSTYVIFDQRITMSPFNDPIRFETNLS